MTLKSGTGNRVDISNRSGCLLLFGLSWSLFAAVFLFIGLGSGQTLFAIFGGLFVLIGLAMMLYGGLMMVIRARVGKPEIHISSTTLLVGEAFSMSLMHQFERSVQVEEMVVQLIFRETATYKQGTDTRTVRHEDVVTEFRAPGRHFQAGSMLSESYQFQIPPTAMHTLKVRRNQLEWFVRFQLAIPRLPDFVEQIELDVLPGLDS